MNVEQLNETIARVGRALIELEGQSKLFMDATEALSELRDEIGRLQ